MISRPLFYKNNELGNSCHKLDNVNVPNYELFLKSFFMNNNYMSWASEKNEYVVAKSFIFPTN